jgi:hypothetical protein
MEKIKREQPNRPRRDFEKWELEIQGAIGWLKRGGGFKQGNEMSDQEAIQGIMLEFLSAFERYTPWLILVETEKGKPIKPGHRVTYYQRDEKSSKALPPPISMESFRPIWKVVDKIWDQEKLMPVDLTFKRIKFSPDGKRAIGNVEIGRYDQPHTDGYFFLFEKREGGWKIRLAREYPISKV